MKATRSPGTEDVVSPQSGWPGTPVRNGFALQHRLPAGPRAQLLFVDHESASRRCKKAKAPPPHAAVLAVRRALQRYAVRIPRGTVRNGFTLQHRLPADPRAQLLFVDHVIMHPLQDAEGASARAIEPWNAACKKVARKGEGQVYVPGSLARRLAGPSSAAVSPAAVLPVVLRREPRQRRRAVAGRAGGLVPL